MYISYPHLDFPPHLDHYYYPYIYPIYYINAQTSTLSSIYSLYQLYPIYPFNTFYTRYSIYYLITLINILTFLFIHSYFTIHIFLSTKFSISTYHLNLPLITLNNLRSVSRCPVECIRVS